MYKNHFGLTSVPFGKDNIKLLNNKKLELFKTQFINLCANPGVGVLTGGPGVGKTAAIRYALQALNQQTHKVFYLPESHFTSYDIYRQFAYELGLKASFRFAEVWRSIKQYIKELVDIKCCRPVIIIDEAQSLKHDFLKDFPAFLNYEYDARDMVTVWFVGLPEFASKLKRNEYIALSSRIRTKCTLEPITDHNSFAALIEESFRDCGCNSRIISDTGIDLLKTATNGNYRLINIMLTESLVLAQQKNLNHISDDVICEAINNLIN